MSRFWLRHSKDKNVCLEETTSSTLSLTDKQLIKPPQKPLSEKRSTRFSKKVHYSGHRERLRKRFHEIGEHALSDYELLELFLFLLLPRSDVKPLAKDLLDRFKNFENILGASSQALLECPGVGPRVLHGFKLIHAFYLRQLKQDLQETPSIIDSLDKLIHYCQQSMGFDGQEQLRLLFLDRKYRLLADEIQQKGTIDHTPIYPREIIKRSLELGATALIMVHNHPSGDPTPSKADLMATLEIQKACAVVGITLIDHLIVGRNKYVSLKSLGSF